MNEPIFNSITACYFQKKKSMYHIFGNVAVPAIAIIVKV